MCLDGTGDARRVFIDVSHEIDRARRSDGRFVVAFADVDRLKIVNDQEGHAAGDRVLQAVVSAIRTRLRSFDPIIRYGGDEFVCAVWAGPTSSRQSVGSTRSKPRSWPRPRRHQRRVGRARRR